MIFQKVILTSYKTNDSKISIEESKVPLNSEFWINANSFQMKEWRATGDKYLMMQLESGDWMPVEMFEFKCEFKVQQ